MKKKRTRDRGAEAIARAFKDIETAGWTIIRPLTTPRIVAVKRVHEREDDTTTTLYESDYTVEGLAALVTRREREEARKS